jgi:hypothetical protein
MRLVSVEKVEQSGNTRLLWPHFAAITTAFVIIEVIVEIAAAAAAVIVAPVAAGNVRCWPFWIVVVHEADQFFQFTAVEPDAAALRAGINQDAALVHFAHGGLTDWAIQ